MLDVLAFNYCQRLHEIRKQEVVEERNERNETQPLWFLVFLRMPTEQTAQKNGIQQAVQKPFEDYI